MCCKGNKRIQWGKLFACGDFSSISLLSKLKHPKYANHGSGRYVFIQRFNFTFAKRKTKP